MVSWDIREDGLSKPIGTAFSIQIVVNDLVEILDQLAVDTIVSFWLRSRPNTSVQVR